MKKLVLSTLTIVLTFITVIVLFTFKTSNIVEVSKPSENVIQEDSKPEGTGYIFDDNGQNINIPYKPVNENGTE